MVGATILIFFIAAVGWTTLSGDNEAVDSVASDELRDGTDALSDTSTTTVAVAQDPPENLGPRKDLVSLDGWLNTDITALDELDGNVVMVEMWTFGCSNCKARIPHTQDLYAKYKEQGFEIVGVHAPEFSYEAEVPNIVEAVERLGVTWPVALDTEKTNFRAWQAGGRRFWPRTYVIDQNGDVRFDHIGEGAYDELDETIGWLLANPPA